MKLPAHVVEDTAGDVIARAITSTFSGESVGEFKSWLSTILKRTVVDFYRERARTIEADPLQGGGETGVALEPRTADETGYVETQMIIEAALAELSEDHRRTVEIIVLEGRSAADACAEIEGMTPDNAYQIGHRFRVRLRELLGGENG
jgi:RNA polymerase sigma-70 factor (ECF subfamily)